MRPGLCGLFPGDPSCSQMPYSPSHCKMKTQKEGKREHFGGVVPAQVCSVPLAAPAEPPREQPLVFRALGFLGSAVDSSGLDPMLWAVERLQLCVTSTGGAAGPEELSPCRAWDVPSSSPFSSILHPLYPTFCILFAQHLPQPFSSLQPSLLLAAWGAGSGFPPGGNSSLRFSTPAVTGM